ncbi:MAG: hypothetical protein F6K25_20450 [Okeania sp. SIO2G4]|nr:MULTISPECIES: hypothetical protein [unclassified Okeania]NEP05507.1 hypothetical protein [Okeania sp. SIO4D6]NEP43941.1 hypothetical protein [Okeania sp. SIO2H7]NEP74215.1 hypothetical protein [Okeania sp. SIO2G5]NEP95092.1 hypothetical protein [Okeania sp. SIO2F5]NEQ92907.1 hypothetical protein [Okeania sp. SIO2G4]
MEKKVVNGKIFRIGLLGYREKYRGKKIGNKLVENNLNITLKQDFPPQ